MKTLRVVAILVVAVFCLGIVANFAVAEEKISIKGKIKDYDLKNRTVTVVTAEGKEMTFTVENESAFKKLDDRLYKDDEVKIKYTIQGGKNMIKGSNDLKGTKPGC